MSELHYVRWKAALFGCMLLSIAGLLMWTGMEAANPAWTANVTDGEWLVAAPNYIRSPFMLAVAGILAIPGIWMLCAACANLVVVRWDQDVIAARTIFGRWRQIRWADIAEAQCSTNRIALTASRAPSLLDQIWDSRAVLLDTGMLVGGPTLTADVVRQGRPDLKFRDIAPPST